MKTKIQELRTQALAEIQSAGDAKAIDELNIRFLGRKGLVNDLLKGMAKIPADEKPLVGSLANELKKDLQDAFAKATESFDSGNGTADAIDVTLPGRPGKVGGLHPLTTINLEICDIFTRLGFDIAQGPEVELDYYNFEALNFPKDHPARDMQDTFFVSDNVVLRTHTSPMQVRTMEKQAPPVRVIAPGKVYRCDSDITHTPMFAQVEGLVVDKGISFADLKGVLTTLIHQIFDNKTPLRFRPSFFPFTEPSAEVDIGCVMCKGKGCRVCSQTGWLEILGSGMVHPKVFEFVGYDTSQISGFAFGMGVERIAMLKYGIDDIRKYYENDVRFLNQF
ncbi:MAG: phenylalanine--tRNA ligase subunit alpha [Desulfatibacillum sp.]|nr:phenylalanine--tRNA ligase subunit alpha [Desulfatibacillum sp.]